MTEVGRQQRQAGLDIGAFAVPGDKAVNGKGVAQITLQRDTRRGVQIDSKAVRYPLGGSLHRIPCKVGVAGGGLDLTVAEKLPDHRQAFPESESPGREGVA